VSVSPRPTPSSQIWASGSQFHPPGGVDGSGARSISERRGAREWQSARDSGSLSEHLQHQAVEYWRTRQRQGEGLRDVAAALGVAPWSLHRWTRASKRRERFHEVQIVAPASRPSDAAPVLIMTADGVRVEGLDVDAAAQLLR
jgi:hypothetical protein